MFSNFTTTYLDHEVESTDAIKTNNYNYAYLKAHLEFLRGNHQTDGPLIKLPFKVHLTPIFFISLSECASCLEYFGKQFFDLVKSLIFCDLLNVTIFCPRTEQLGIWDEL